MSGNSIPTTCCRSGCIRADARFSAQPGRLLVEKFGHQAGGRSCPAVPTQLKAWFDHFTRAGTTFQYTEQGSKGLLEGKRAVVFTSRGGYHRDAASDAVAPFLRAVLGLIGIDEVEIVYAEGLAMGEAPRESAMDEAAREVERLATALPRVA